MNLKLISMELFLLFWGILLLVLNFLGVKKSKSLGTIAIVGIIIDSVLGFVLLIDKNMLICKYNNELYKGFSYYLDPLSFFFKELFCLIFLIVFLISIDYFNEESSYNSEYFALLTITCVGMMMMVSSGDFLLLFISMELISIPLYILAAFNKNRRESSEAGFKYFITGAFSSALFLFGVSILYGNSGSFIFLSDKYGLKFATILSNTDITSLNTFSQSFSGAVMLGITLIILGLGFKIAASPFHMWAPDVYEGAPTPVTALISVGPKIAGIAVILRFFMGGLSSLIQFWAPVFSIMALLSIIIGNLSALRQKNIKRLLAYSGIAQIGYILLGLIGSSRDSKLGITSVLFYITVYAITNLGAFSVAILCEKYYKSDNFEDFTGLNRKSQALTFIMTISLLSLAGIPPLAGFIGKFYLFMSAYNAFDHKLALFVLIAIVFSVISLFYYLRVLKVMYFEEPSNQEAFLIPGSYMIALCISTLAICFLGLIPSFYSLIYYLSSFIS